VTCIVISGGRITELLLPLGATGARFFTNAVDTWTRGIDVTAAYTHPFGDRARLRMSGAYNLNRNKVLRVADTPPQLAGFEAVLFDRVERRRIECGQPRNNYRFTGELTGGRIGGTLRASRYGEYCIVDRNVVDQSYAPEWVTDLGARSERTVHRRRARRMCLTGVLIVMSLPTPTLVSSCIRHAIRHEWLVRH
jgi:iron complex outermembrane receptor protein